VNDEFYVMIYGDDDSSYLMDYSLYNHKFCNLMMKASFFEHLKELDRYMTCLIWKKLSYNFYNNHFWLQTFLILSFYFIFSYLQDGIMDLLL